LTRLHIHESGHLSRQALFSISIVLKIQIQSHGVIGSNPLKCTCIVVSHNHLITNTFSSSNTLNVVAQVIPWYTNEDSNLHIEITRAITSFTVIWVKDYNW